METAQASPLGRVDTRINPQYIDFSDIGGKIMFEYQVTLTPEFGASNAYALPDGILQTE